MKEISKRVWAVRLLALLVMSFGFSFLGTTTYESRQTFKKRVVIKANENVGEIVSVVEKLDRDDIYIKVRDESWYRRKPIFLWVGAGLFVGLGFLLGIYHTVYCVINGLLNYRKRDETLLRTGNR